MIPRTEADKAEWLASRPDLLSLQAVNDGVTIRPYRPEDRPMIERICQETGLRGELDTLFCDRPLFVKLWLSPYLDGEPENSLVAEQDGEIVGYMVSSIRPGFHQRALQCLFPHLLTLIGRWLTGRYRNHPPSERFVRWFLFRSWREMPQTPKAFAHFHFNVAPELVAILVGERLIARFEENLFMRGLDGWHAILFSSPTKRPVGMYKRMGFTIIDQKPCTLFPEGDVTAVCIHKSLTDPLKMARVPMKAQGNATTDPEERPKPKQP